MQFNSPRSGYTYCGSGTHYLTTNISVVCKKNHSQVYICPRIRSSTILHSTQLFEIWAAKYVYFYYTNQVCLLDLKMLRFHACNSNLSPPTYNTTLYTPKYHSVHAGRHVSFHYSYRWTTGRINLWFVLPTVVLRIRSIQRDEKGEFIASIEQDGDKTFL
jgi:hypothetical protein